MTDAPTHRTGEERRRQTCGASARRWLCACASALLATAGCRGRRSEQPAAPSQANDVPVAINSESPFQYPADLYDQGVEGEVRLRLYVDSLGHVLPESTRVAASSGTPALDSAAVRGAPLLTFAPAHKDGRPVAAAFYQPVVFRRRAQRAGAGAP
jgi:TonB family protein